MSARASLEARLDEQRRGAEEEAARARSIGEELEKAQEQLARDRERLAGELAQHQAATEAQEEHQRETEVRLEAERARAASAVATVEEQRSEVLEARAQVNTLGAQLRAALDAGRELAVDRERLARELAGEVSEKEKSEERRREAEGRQEAERAEASSKVASLEASLEAQRREMESRALTLEGQLKGVEEARAELARELAAEVSEKEKSEERRREAESRAVALEGQRKGVEEALGSLEASLEAQRREMESRAVALEGQLKGVEEERAELARELAGEVSEKEKSEERRREAEGRQEAERAEASSKVASLEASVEAQRREMQAQATALEGRLQVVQEARARLTAEHERLARELAEEKQASEERQREAEERQRETEGRLEAETRSLEARLQGVLDARAKLLSDRDELARELAAEKQSSEDRQREAEGRLEAERASARALLEASLEAAGRAGVEAQLVGTLALEGQLQAAESARVQLLSDLERLTRDLTAEKRASAERHREAEGRLEAERADAASALASLEARLATEARAGEADASAQATIAELRATLAERDQLIADHQWVRREYEARRSGFEAALTGVTLEADTRVGDAEATLQAERERLTELQGRLEQASAAAAKSARDAAAREEAIAKLERELAAERLARTVRDEKDRRVSEDGRTADYRVLPASGPAPSQRSRSIRPLAEARDPRDVLRSVLTRALGAGRAEIAIKMALGAARRTELPVESDELLALVERHLLVELTANLGQAPAHTMMDDLAAQLATATPAAPAVEMQGVQRRTTKPPAESAGANASRRPSRPAPNDAKIKPARRRRSVLVIERDRVARTAISRALARAGCEVSVRDSCAEIGTGARDFEVIVTGVVGVAIEELLTTFAQRPPPCKVVAWAEGIEGARAMFTTAGLRGVSFVARESRPDSLVSAVRVAMGDAPEPPRS